MDSTEWTEPLRTPADDLADAFNAQARQLERERQHLNNLTHLCAELRDALPDAYVDRHLEQCVAAPEGLLVAVISAFETGRFGLYPETSEEWNEVLSWLGKLYEAWCYLKKPEFSEAVTKLMTAYDAWLDVPMVRKED